MIECGTEHIYHILPAPGQCPGTQDKIKCDQEHARRLGFHMLDDDLLNSGKAEIA